MKFITKISVLFLLVFSACSGVDSVTKKRYANSENTIVLIDLTRRSFDLQDAGSQLQSSIEQEMLNTSYALTGEGARYRPGRCPLRELETIYIYIYTLSLNTLRECF